MFNLKRNSCWAMVCLLTMSLVAPPTLAQTYVDPLTQRFDQALATRVAEVPVPAVAVIKDTQPSVGARIQSLTNAKIESYITTVGSEAEKQSKVASAESSKLAIEGASVADAALWAAIVAALTLVVVAVANNDNSLNLTTTTSTR